LVEPVVARADNWFGLNCDHADRNAMHTWRVDQLPSGWDGGLLMDKDRVKGAAHEVKGAVKEAAGKVTGDTKTQAEGKAEKVGGKVQNAAGGAKDAVRDAVNNR
jgi:uncharacterized protein YjbJ (UPF0337 family)